MAFQMMRGHVTQGLLPWSPHSKKTGLTFSRSNFRTFARSHFPLFPTV